MIYELHDDGYRRQIFAQGKKAAIAKLLKLRQQAQRDNEPRMMLCIWGILRSLDGYTAGEIADHPKVQRRTVPLRIDISGTGKARKACWKGIAAGGRRL